MITHGRRKPPMRDESTHEYLGRIGASYGVAVSDIQLWRTEDGGRTWTVDGKPWRRRRAA